MTVVADVAVIGFSVQRYNLMGIYVGIVLSADGTSVDIAGIGMADAIAILAAQCRFGLAYFLFCNCLVTLRNYLLTDTLLVRADPNSEAELTNLQEKHHSPIIKWFEKEFGVQVRTRSGFVALGEDAQPRETMMMIDSLLIAIDLTKLYETT